MAAIVVLTGAVVAGTGAAAGSSPSRLYAAGATQACLESLSDAVAGLPPALPPRPSALFVYRFPLGVDGSWWVSSSARGALGAWYGQRARGSYEGIYLGFFATPRLARAAFMSPESRYGYLLYGGKLIGNVVVAWAQRSVPSGSVQKAVLSCLRGGTSRPAPRRPIPRASLATFEGSWGGHTRRLVIGRDGRGYESVNDGCCHFVIGVSFTLLRASGTIEDATGTIRVTAVKRGEWSSETRPRIGQLGELKLKKGILTDALTGIYYCSAPTWSATGACGL
jgi:hypothetical protein